MFYYILNFNLNDRTIIKIYLKFRELYFVKGYLNFSCIIKSCYYYYDFFKYAPFLHNHNIIFLE